MRRILAVLTLVAAALGLRLWADSPAYAQANGSSYAAVTTTFQCPTDGGSCTDSSGCSGLSSTAGLSLDRSAAYAVSVAVPVLPDAGQAALSGGGSLLCCFQTVTSSTGVHGSTPTRAWARCKTSLDVSLSEAGGRTTYPEPSFSTGGLGHGRVYYYPSAVTHDGGGIASGVMPVDVSISTAREPR